MLSKGMIVLAIVLSLCAVSVSFAGEESAADVASSKQVAIDSVGAWLGVVDNGQYDLSWEQASTYFKTMVKKELWVSQLSAVRSLFGKFVSRQEEDSQYYTQLPGAPDGEYYLITFRSSFSKKVQAVETLTLKKDEDGKWRVAGYYIK